MAKRSHADDLECPVCIEQLYPPIFQCVNGHLVCYKCLARIETSTRKCPTCRVALSYDRIRCLQADRRVEALIRTLPQSSHETQNPSSSSADIPSVAEVLLPVRNPGRYYLSDSVKQGLAKWSVKKCPRLSQQLPLRAPPSRHFSPTLQDEQFNIFVYKVTNDASWLWPFFEGIPNTTLYQLQLNYAQSWPNIYAGIDEYLSQCASDFLPGNLTALLNYGLKIVTAGNNPRAPVVPGRVAIYIAEEHGTSDILVLTLHILTGFVEWLGKHINHRFHLHVNPHISARVVPANIEACTVHAPKQALAKQFWEARPCFGNRRATVYITSPASKWLCIEIHSTIEALRKMLELNFPDRPCSDCGAGEEEAKSFRFVLNMETPQRALVHKLFATFNELATRVIVNGDSRMDRDTTALMSELHSLRFLHF